MNEASEPMTSELTRRDAVRSDLEGIVELSPGGHYAIRIEPGGDSKLLYASRKVQEIIGYMAITPVPRTPDYLRGVINLRGKIIPVVDLRLKLGLPPLEGQTCIIVVRARGLEVGITVDQVSEVANIADKDIEPVPAFGNGVATEDLLGIGKTGGRVRLLLDIDRILSAIGSRKILSEKLPASH